MRCIYCNTPLAAIDYCPGCGADVTLQKRIVRISNLLYNEGLEKALVRDMEGAITCLKRSLKFNKENIDARNLLGLCYYETGEAVSALCEWVISKNLKGEDNIADSYINELQSNKNRLDTINQTIRKYNQSVLYCREDNEDMAIIQLKKVISQNPKFVKAYQLLALLYMKRQEYERARKLLKKAANIDTTNTTTLRYLQEIEDVTGKSTRVGKKHWRFEKEKEDAVSGTLRYMSGTEMVIQPTTFRDSSTIATFINIILGILLGGAIVWFLVVPANRQEVNDEANRQVTDANTKLASEAARAQDLQDEIDGYKSQVDSANQDKEDALKKAQSYDDLLAAVNKYVSGDVSGASTAVAALDASDFEGNAKTLYDSMASAVGTSLFSQYYNTGATAYLAGDYTTAADQLQKAVDADTERKSSDYAQAMLCLGISYYQLGQQDKANEILNKFIEYYPNQASQAQGYITSGSSKTSGNNNAADVSGLGDAATGQTANNTQTSTTNGGDITIYNQDGTTGGSSLPASDSYVAWTDPTTGLQYDQYGNLMSGQ
ncbi:MAG: tetratricopeptide repeat protein [Lachnospiraceae bacterium]|nr:tetratricopeptide repeat protein [Lachnospiraceae bacterium]